MKTLQERYAEANVFLRKMKQYNRILSTWEYHRLKQQALNGDLNGADKELMKAVRKAWENGRK